MLPIACSLVVKVTILLLWGMMWAQESTAQSLVIKNGNHLLNNKFINLVSPWFYVMFIFPPLWVCSTWYMLMPTAAVCGVCDMRSIPGPNVGPWAARTRPSGCAAEVSRWWAPAQGGLTADACTASSDAGMPLCTLNTHTGYHKHSSTHMNSIVRCRYATLYTHNHTQRAEQDIPLLSSGLSIPSLILLKLYVL